MPTTKTQVPETLDRRVLTRILEEGYGPQGGPGSPGAWHGADLATALTDISPALAFWRPAPARHNIAELAVHHAYYQHSVRGRLSTATLESFPLEGDDFFALDDESILSWSAIRGLVETQQRLLAETVISTGEGRERSGFSERELRLLCDSRRRGESSNERADRGGGVEGDPEFRGRRRPHGEEHRRLVRSVRRSPRHAPLPRPGGPRPRL